MQTDAIAHQHGRQDHTFEQLADHEHHTDADQRIGLKTELEQCGSQRRTDTDDEAHIGHDTRQASQHTDQQPQLQPHQHQASGVDDAQRQHYHQLAAQEGAQYFMTFACQLDYQPFALTR